MKVKNFILGIIIIAAIVSIVFFAIKMTKDIRHNDINAMNVVEAESEEVVSDSSNEIEESNEVAEENQVESEVSNETIVEENKVEENQTANNETETGGCNCGCGRDTPECCD